MKLNKIIVTVVFLFLCYTTKVTAQQVGFTYQAVAIDESKAQGFGRDSRGEILVNKPISLRFSIREGAEEGEIKYQETHHTTTDIFGIFRLVIGRGLNVTGSPLVELQWGEVAYFLQVEIDLGGGFEFMGVEELLGVPYALNIGKQQLSLEQNELSISNGNSVILNDNDPTNELITGFSIQGTELQLTDAAGTKSVDLKDVAGGTLNEAEVDAFVTNNGFLTNEVQDLQLIGNILSITNLNAGTQIDLSPYLDDTNLTENEVDAFVSNNGYLTNEIDGSVTNEIQNISTNGTSGNISISGGATLNLNVDDADASPTNEIQNLNLANNTLSITNNAAATPISLAPYLDAAFRTTANVTSNAPGNYIIDDFVFGSPQLADDGDSDHDNRMFFDKSKGAFRVGRSTIPAIWDDLYVGQFSFAMGDNARATNSCTFAVGQSPNASGSEAIAIGSRAQATASSSISIGYQSNASGSYSVAMGTNTVSSGNTSVSAGLGTLSRSNGEAALGMYNTDYTPNSTFAFNAVDRIFVIGNGTVVANVPARSDALVMLKNGNTRLHGQLTIDADNVTGVGGSYTFPGQRGVNGQVMVTDGTGILSWSTLPVPAFTTNASVTSNAPGNYATDDFLFGAPTLAYNNNTLHRSRMFFDKSKGAFRAGIPTGTQFDDVNVGAGSVAFGSGIASGSSSVAMGSGTIASGTHSVAFGTQTTASGAQSFAMGIATSATGNDSFAFGNGTNATNSSAIAIGWSAAASGFASIAIGSQITASGIYGVSIGQGNTAGGSYSLAMGRSTSSTGYSSTALGDNTVANGQYAMATGFTTSASGLSAFAGGSNTQSIGTASFAAGINTTAYSFGETAFGTYATTYSPISSITFNASDQLFRIGNGTSTSNRSNALVILKNGNTTLNGQLTIDADNITGAGGSYTFPGQRGTNGQVMMTDGAGVLSWSTLPIPTITTTANVSSNANGDYMTDDFVFGSPQLADDGNNSHRSRMFFDKSKGAFRAGTASNHWDDLNVGYFSTALGFYNIASGGYSFSTGFQAQASGSFSVAIGSGTASGLYSKLLGNGLTSAGNNSLALGNFGVASAEYSIILGTGNTATGSYANAYGLQTLSRSYSETVVGLNNSDYTAIGSSTYEAADRLFVIGNGTTGSNRSDALVMLKNGYTLLHGLFAIDADNVSGAGGSYTFPGQRGTNGQVMITDGSGVLSWTSLAVPTITTATNVSSNANGDYAMDDFVFGSPSLDNDGDASHSSRILFDKSNGAFRSGSAENAEWDGANRGANSTALGSNNVAPGEYSFAAGRHNLAYSASSVAIGTNNQAEGYNSIALGRNVATTGVHSMALSLYGSSRSYGETTMGIFAADYVPNSTTNFDANDRLFTIGNGVDDGNRSNALVIFKNGDATLLGILTDASDVRLKRNVKSLNNSLSAILSLRGVHYQWNGLKPQDTIALQTGFIAQEIESVLPELVKTDSDGFKSVNYIGLIPHLVEAIKELKTQNEQLRNDKENMQSENNKKINAIEARLAAIEKMMSNSSTSEQNTTAEYKQSKD